MGRPLVPLLMMSHLPNGTSQCDERSLHDAALAQRADGLEEPLEAERGEVDRLEALVHEQLGDGAADAGRVLEACLLYTSDAADE